MTIQEAINLHSQRTGTRTLPSIEYLSKQTGKSFSEINLILQDMKKRGEIVTYKGKQYIKKTAKREHVTTNVYNNRLFVTIRWAMLLIGIVSVSVSIYYSSMFLDAYMPRILAIALGCTMVIYGSGGIEIGVLLWKNKNKLTGVLLALTAVIVIVFSMLSTLLVQYKQTDNIKLEITQRDSTNLEYQLQSVRKDIERTQLLLADFDTLEDRAEGGGAYYWSTKNDLETYKAQEQTILSEISQNSEQLQESSTTQDRAIQYLQTLLHMDASTVKFVISSFPATYIDLISPLCFAVFLFFRKKETSVK